MKIDPLKESALTIKTVLLTKSRSGNFFHYYRNLASSRFAAMVYSK